MSYNLSIYGFDEEAFEAGAIETPADYLEGGSELRYPQWIWLNGLKNFIMVADPNGSYKTPQGTFKKTRNAAVGLHCEVAKMPDSMLKAALRMARTEDEHGKRVEPTGEFLYAYHDDGRIKEYFRIFQPRFYVLSHGAPSAGSVMGFRDGTWQYSENKILGLAAGSYTNYRKDKKEQNTSNFVAFLAVEKHLMDNGYTDKETGLPGVAIVKMSSLNSKAMQKILLSHYNFILNHRKRVAADMLEKKVVKSRPAADFLARQRVQFWSYGISIYETEDTVKHEGKKGNQEVFEPNNYSEEDYAYFEASERLYVGDDKYEAIMSWVYDMTAKPRPVLGGPAIEWCLKQVQNAVKNQEEWNPRNDLEFGTHPAPNWMIARAMKSAASFDEPDDDAPATATSRSNGGEDALQRRFDAMYKMVDLNNDFFTQQGDDEGMAIMDTLLEKLAKVSGISDQLKLVQAAKEASAARRSFLGGAQGF
jgi:hypothetical protein